MPSSPISSRRGFLRTAIALVPAGTLAGCEVKQSTTTVAPGSSANTSADRASGADYKSHFFDAKEWAFI
ncbi:gluconate 2-dehydrogenase subunit 3 family protein, partial [Paraburkholderia sp. RL18-101-BIB-B]